MATILGFWAGAWLLRVLGPQAMLVGAMVLGGVRCALYPLLTHDTRWFVLLIQALHGCQWALLWNGGVQLAKQLAPPSRQASAQGLFNAAYFGVGASAGLALGGVLYSAVGPHGMFWWKGVIVAAALALFVLLWACGSQLGRAPHDPAEDEATPLLGAA